MQDMGRMRVADLTIVHTTGLRDQELPAFAHAVALARESRSKLLSLHAGDDPAARARMPRAADLLAHWGALPRDATEGEEQKLGMRHERVLDSCCDDPVDTLIRAVRQASPDLLVGATSGRDGLARALLGSIAEAMALHVHVPALLFPTDCKPFVHPLSGSVALQRILVAAGDAHTALAGARHALWLAELAQARDASIELMHVNDGGELPSLVLPESAGARVYTVSTRGAVETTLLGRAGELGADLIVMATRGHDSLEDVLLGSHAERVLRHAPCPVLLVPIP